MSSREARRNKAFQSKQGGTHSAHMNRSYIGDGKRCVPFKAHNTVETPATSFSGAQELTWLGERALCWMQLARGGWRTRCLP